MIKYKTVDYICPKCNFKVRVRVVAPEYHALHYRQAIDPEDCFRCKAKTPCHCNTCTAARDACSISTITMYNKISHQASAYPSRRYLRDGISVVSQQISSYGKR